MNESRCDEFFFLAGVYSMHNKESERQTKWPAHPPYECLDFGASTFDDNNIDDNIYILISGAVGWFGVRVFVLCVFFFVCVLSVCICSAVGGFGSTRRHVSFSFAAATLASRSTRPAARGVIELVYVFGGLEIKNITWQNAEFASQWYQILRAKQHKRTQCLEILAS